MMACVDKMPQNNGESEMEEGEIVDELDDLSDISSEEEFLMRQRLEVLENYNNVLERTKAKRSSMGSGAKPKREIVCHLSEISANKLNENHLIAYEHNIKIQRHIKPYKPKRKKEPEQSIDETYARRKKDYKKRNVRGKKRVESKVVDTSDESEDEYRNKRKKLADAVIVPKHKSDKSSLSARLFKMMHGTDIQEEFLDHKEDNKTNLNEGLSLISSVNTNEMLVDEPDGAKVLNEKITKPIDLSTDEDVKEVSNVIQEKTNPSIDTKEGEFLNEKDSDDDLELLRQHALESKPLKPKTTEPEKTDKILSEDEDSDTTELRLICLKSALLKKAIEMKQKQKLQKRLSTSNLDDDLFNDQIYPTKEDIDNNTDIESVDMDMGSDTEDKLKDCNVENTDDTGLDRRIQESANDLINCAINLNATKDDELDEDEDLLRAKLLTSLSKNLTNLVTPEILDKVDEKIGEVKTIDNTPQQNTAPKSEEKPRFIIQVNESDSEGEHEATKNLTKMHLKLSEQIDFQQKLDLFLKSARNQVEKKDITLPDVVQKSPVPKKPEKFVAKTVKHLPKSEQIEYKNLVRRMAELEKIKQSRQQAMMYQINQPIKDTLKPRNVTIDTQSEINNNLEEQIAKSRKLIAEESVKMLKLKEEATKLAQKYKIAATELRNITTAIALNKKQQRTIQNSLTKIRLQHQSLLKNSTTSLHFKVNGRASYLNNLNTKPSSKLQKENNPKDEYNNPQIQKAVKVSVVNDFVDVVTPTRLSVQVDIANNKKVVKVPEDSMNDRIVEMNEDKVSTVQSIELQLPDNSPKEEEKEIQSNTEENGELVAVCDHGNKRYYISVDDYKSPLDALGTTKCYGKKVCIRLHDYHRNVDGRMRTHRFNVAIWKEDPNAILCPFEVRGQCKDPDCKYLHASPSLQ